jgi:hypothetical protein
MIEEEQERPDIVFFISVQLFNAVPQTWTKDIEIPIVRGYFDHTLLGYLVELKEFWKPKLEEDSLLNLLMETDLTKMELYIRRENITNTQISKLLGIKDAIKMYHKFIFNQKKKKDNIFFQERNIQYSMISLENLEGSKRLGDIKDEEFSFLQKIFDMNRLDNEFGKQSFINTIIALSLSKIKQYGFRISDEYQMDFGKYKTGGKSKTLHKAIPDHIISNQSGSEGRITSKNQIAVQFFIEDKFKYDGYQLTQLFDQIKTYTLILDPHLRPKIVYGVLTDLTCWRFAYYIPTKDLELETEDENFFISEEILSILVDKIGATLDKNGLNRIMNIILNLIVTQVPNVQNIKNTPVSQMEEQKIQMEEEDLAESEGTNESNDSEGTEDNLHSLQDQNLHLLIHPDDLPRDYWKNRKSLFNMEDEENVTQTRNRFETQK